MDNTILFFLGKNVLWRRKNVNHGISWGKMYVKTSVRVKYGLNSMSDCRWLGYIYLHRFDCNVKMWKL